MTALQEEDVPAEDDAPQHEAEFSQADKSACMPMLSSGKEVVLDEDD